LNVPQAAQKLYPKLLLLSKKFRLGTEGGKIALLGLAAVAFVFGTWILFDRRSTEDDADEKLRPLSQAPEARL
jgi:hypothetical protein